MTPEEKEKLSKKLVDLVNHSQKLGADKKEVVGSYVEQIKEADKKIKCLANALKFEDTLLLLDVFDSSEVDHILGR